MTREQAEKMAHAVLASGAMRHRTLQKRIADALQVVGEDTQLLNWLERNCLFEGNSFRFTIPAWYEGKDRPPSLRKSIAARVESEEPRP